MRSLAIFVLAAAFALPAWAQSVAFGSKLITVGDPVGKVFQVAGQPARTVQLENKFGANNGERLEYYVGNKTILITVRGGTVVQVQEVF